MDNHFFHTTVVDCSPHLTHMRLQILHGKKSCDDWWLGKMLKQFIDGPPYYQQRCCLMACVHAERNYFEHGLWKKTPRLAQFLAERCNSIAKFGYWHACNVSSVCHLSVCNASVLWQNDWNWFFLVFRLKVATCLNFWSGKFDDEIRRRFHWVRLKLGLGGFQLFFAALHIWNDAR